MLTIVTLRGDYWYQTAYLCIINSTQRIYKSACVHVLQSTFWAYAINSGYLEAICNNNL